MPAEDGLRSPGEVLEPLLQGLLAEGWTQEPDQLPTEGPERRRLLRALMNARPPLPISQSLLAMQDRILLAERSASPVADPMRLSTVRDQFPATAVPCADRLVLWQGDITRLSADAIVNAANAKLLGCFIPHHRCIDNAIHSAAGIQLRMECHRIMQQQGADEPTGRAKLTSGGNLPARHVIHTVGPIIRSAVRPADESLLASCYTSCLELAAGHSDIKSIAFCCISTGEFRFPKPAAAAIAVRTVTRWLGANAHDLRRVVFNVFTSEDHEHYARIFRAN